MLDLHRLYVSSFSSPSHSRARFIFIFVDLFISTPLPIHLLLSGAVAKRIYFEKPDKMPRISICRKRANKDTSSEDNDSSRDRYNRRHHRDSTQMRNGSSNTREERNGRNGRYHPPRQHGSHRSETPSNSRDDRRPTSTRTHTSRRSRRSPSPELVRLVRHIHLSQAPRSRSRGRSRTPRSPTSRYRYSSRGDEARRVYDGKRPNARGRSFEREPSVVREETLHGSSRPARSIRIQVPHEQPLRSRSMRSVQIAHASDERRHSLTRVGRYVEGVETPPRARRHRASVASDFQAESSEGNSPPISSYRAI